jgi:hypothetical protein
MNRHYPEVASRARHRCEYWGAPEVVFNFPFEIEHILPTATGGVDEPQNKALACRSCNIYKSSKTHHQDDVSGDAVPIFHPREHNWDEHFAIESTTGEITGKSATGRATIALLRLNSASQLASRLLWIKLGLYP